MRPVLLVIAVNLLCAVAGYTTYAMGQIYAPELMASQAMNAPLVLGALGLAGWLLYWSIHRLNRGGQPKKRDD